MFVFFFKFSAFFEVTAFGCIIINKGKVQENELTKGWPQFCNSLSSLTLQWRATIRFRRLAISHKKRKLGKVGKCRLQASQDE